MRVSGYFIGLCMVIIAGSLGAAVYLTFGLSPVESAAVAMTVLSLLTAYNAFTGRASDRAAFSHQITGLSRGTADLARQVGELGRRVVVGETALAQLDERMQAATDPLSGEIEVLGTLVKQLAESVAAHEVALLGTVGQAPGASLFASAGDAPGSQMRAAEATIAPSGGPAVLAASEVPGVVRAALEGNRLDLYLQPIVTLPQRKVRYYEALTRLRTEDGAVLLPADYLEPAENAGLMPLIDNQMLFRSVQVVRRITAKNREVGLFCNIAGSTLVDAEFFPQFFEFLNANRALAPALVLEFSQRTVRAMGPIEHESLGQLAALGFRFSVDQVTDLQFEPRLLAEQGFRFLKVPATFLLNRSLPATSDIHASDFANLLARYGIDLIAEKIESEGTVVDLLDYEVRFGQGFLFAPPRPVRGEVFAGGSERAPAASAAPARREGATPSTTGQAAGRQPDNGSQPSPSPERTVQSLVQLARNMAQRA